MDRSRTIAPAFLLLAGAAWAVACGDGATEPPPPAPPPGPPPRATTVAVTPAEAELTALGQTVRLSAQVRDQNGRAMAGAAVAWSSGDASVATVDGSGVATAAGNGTVTITATSGSVSGSAALTVAQAVSAVAVSPAADTLLALGDTLRLTAEARDANGHAVADVEFGWASGDTSVARVDATGLVTGVGAGEVDVTASAGDASGEAAVTVMQSVGSIVVTPAVGTVVIGGTLRLAAQAFDDNGNAVAGAEFEWLSSDVTVATVDDGGLVRGQAPGTATVAASSGDARGTAEITVQSPEENPERAALAALYRAADGPNWRDATNWLTDKPLGEWRGVDTDASGRVVRLDLAGPPQLTWGQPIRNGGLRGRIPSALGGLARLTHLNLGGNDLSGPIPTALGGLAHLVELSLDDNALTGPVPPELGALTRLQVLNLSGNGLEGAIPPALSDLGRLTELKLARNPLSGAIPRGLLGLANLNVLSLEGAGALCAPGTTEFRDWLAGIDEHDAVYCSEPERGVLEALYEATGGPGWTNADGWLGGSILGDWHGVRTDSLGRVVALALEDNGLSGRLPPSLGALERLTEFAIGGNPNLGGRLPPSLTRLSLRTFDYAETGLCEPAEASFRDWLGTIASHHGSGVECAPISDRTILEALYHATDGPNWDNNRNWLTDAPLGQWDGVDTDASGRVVRLHVKGLAGPLPPELGGLAQLTVLDLGANRLTGTIPPELGDLANLEWMNLGTNDLTGPIPPELGGLARLRAVYFDRNNLTGPIPRELGGLSNLTRLYLYRNDLSGPIPPELGRLADLEGFNFDRNHLTGPIPPELGNLTRLRELSLGHNRLTGPIPPELGGLANLTRLRLNNNDLSGPIPPQLTRLTRLESVNFGDNRDLCIPGDPELPAWLIAWGFSALPCPDPGAPEPLLRVILREDGNGLSVELPDDLRNSAAVSASDPAVVTVREDAGWLVLSPVGLGAADVEVVPAEGGESAFFEVVVRPAQGTFGIDIVMTQPALVGYEEAMMAATDWWSSILDGTEWPDREITAEDSESCFRGYGRGNVWKYWKVKGTVDELVIVTANRHGAGAGVGACLKRAHWNAEDSPEAHYPLAGHIMMDPRLGWAGHDVGVMKHEIGHMLGLVMRWLLQVGVAAPAGDQQGGGDGSETVGYLLGPRALEAFRAGGGDPAPDALRFDAAGHWLPDTVPCELMGGQCDAPTDGLSLATLADMGYTVNMSKATPWRRRANAAAITPAFAHDVTIVELPDPPPPARDPPR